jgi:hypothetical protein
MWSVRELSRPDLRALELIQTQTPTILGARSLHGHLALQLGHFRVIVLDVVPETAQLSQTLQSDLECFLREDFKEDLQTSVGGVLCVSSLSGIVSFQFALVDSCQVFTLLTKDHVFQAWIWDFETYTWNLCCSGRMLHEDMDFAGMNVHGQSVSDGLVVLDVVLLDLELKRVVFYPVKIPLDPSKKDSSSLGPPQTIFGELPGSISVRKCTPINHGCLILLSDGALFFYSYFLAFLQPLLHQELCSDIVTEKSLKKTLAVTENSIYIIRESTLCATNLVKHVLSKDLSSLFMCSHFLLGIKDRLILVVDLVGTDDSFLICHKLPSDDVDTCVFWSLSSGSFGFLSRKGLFLLSVASQYPTGLEEGYVFGPSGDPLVKHSILNKMNVSENSFLSKSAFEDFQKKSSPHFSNLDLLNAFPAALGLQTKEIHPLTSPFVQGSLEDLQRLIDASEISPSREILDSILKLCCAEVSLVSEEVSQSLFFPEQVALYFRNSPESLMKFFKLVDAVCPQFVFKILLSIIPNVFEEESQQIRVVRNVLFFLESSSSNALCTIERSRFWSLVQLRIWCMGIVKAVEFCLEFGALDLAIQAMTVKLSQESVEWIWCFRRLLDGIGKGFDDLILESIPHHASYTLSIFLRDIEIAMTQNNFKVSCQFLFKAVRGFQPNLI